jgi:hypothetical protein
MRKLLDNKQKVKFEAFKFGGLENYAYLCKQLKTNII